MLKAFVFPGFENFLVEWRGKFVTDCNFLFQSFGKIGDVRNAVGKVIQFFSEFVMINFGIIKGFENVRDPFLIVIGDNILSSVFEFNVFHGSFDKL